MKAERDFAVLLSVALAAAGFAGCSAKKVDSGATGGAGAVADVASASKTTGLVAASSSTTSPVTASSGGGGGIVASNLGLGCNVDADCAGDQNNLTCVTSTTNDPVLGGAPGGGYCSKTCVTNTDCPADGVCVGTGTANGPKECWLSCTIGPPLTSLNEMLDPSKCQGRQDLRCAPLSMTDYACVPTCGDNAGCDPSLVCDPAAGVCVDPATIQKGDPTGAKCDAAATGAGTCAGACITFTGTTDTICTSPCTLGGDPATSNNCGGELAGICAFATADAGAGDSGFCTNSCVKQDDCQNPAFWCFDVHANNGKGYCFGGIDCPNGDADCVDSNMNPLAEKCHATKYGPKCIDPVTYPLGTAAVGGAGGSGGGSVGVGGGASSSSSSSASTGVVSASAAGTSTGAGGSKGAGGSGGKGTGSAGGAGSSVGATASGAGGSTSSSSGAGGAGGK